MSEGSVGPEMANPSAEGADARARGGLVGGLIKTIRPHQWVKNLFVLAPIVFAKDLFDRGMMLRTLTAVGVFCILSGAVYTLNDLVDVEADRVHPIKRNRPIASGRVPVAVARVFFVALLVTAIGAGFLLLRKAFVAAAAAYFLLNVAYSFKLKNIPFVDVACFAGFFVLRVLAGGYAINVHVSWYMTACTALIALFLAFGKRRHEIAQEHAGKQRKALQRYTASGLNTALAITGAATFLTYVAYTLDPATRKTFHSDALWMTAPSVLLGITRFVQIVRGHPKAESPTQEMLRDAMFVLNLVAWAAVVLVIVYQIRPTAVP
jgi:decaprenyl-phosphate phosphoribosyltransferase